MVDRECGSKEQNMAKQTIYRVIIRLQLRITLEMKLNERDINGQNEISAEMHKKD